MKKRKKGQSLVVFGFSGNLQDDLDRYQGVQQVAVAAGWQLLVLQEHFEHQLRSLLSAGAVDGVIGEFISASWLRSLPSTVPCVHVGQGRISDTVAAVMFDPEMIGRIGYEHLKKSGYEKVCLYTPSAHGVLEPLYEEGFQAVASARDLVLHGASELSRYLQAADAPTGIFCLSDYDARHVMLAAGNAGLAIPSQIGILGLGNRLWDRIVAGIEISSIPLPQVDLGLQAGKLLREQIEGGSVRSVRLAPQDVIARASTMRTSGSDEWLVRRVEAYFREHLGGTFSIQDLCARMHVSQRTVELAFRRARQGTPYQCLMQMRFEEACRLLRETDLRINRIGERVGYPVPQQFSAFFVGRQGGSPSAYRESEMCKCASTQVRK